MNKQNKPTVLIDTNLLVSAIIVKDSTPNKLLTAWKEDKYTLVVSEELIAEVESVLKREKIYLIYHISQDEIKEFIEQLRISVQIVTPLSLYELPIHSRDINDNKLLTCALSGKCDYLVTGDNDLLVLAGNLALGITKIVTVNNFLIFLTT